MQTTIQPAIGFRPSAKASASAAAPRRELPSAEASDSPGFRESLNTATDRTSRSRNAGSRSESRTDSDSKSSATRAKDGPSGEESVSGTDASAGGESDEVSATEKPETESAGSAGDEAQPPVVTGVVDDVEPDSPPPSSPDGDEAAPEPFEGQPSVVAAPQAASQGSDGALEADESADTPVKGEPPVTPPTGAAAKQRGSATDVEAQEVPKSADPAGAAATGDTSTDGDGEHEAKGGRNPAPVAVEEGEVVQPAARRSVAEVGSILPDSAPAEATAGEGRAAQPVTAVKAAAGSEPGLVARGPLSAENLDSVVASVRGGLADGKSRHEMTVRLDPPSLGAMRVRMEMVEGQLTATFSTSSEVTHRLMQQSLQSLRASLEQAGFSVDRLQVQRTPEASSGQAPFQQDTESGGEGRQQMQHHQREQQRRETLIRLWRGGAFEDRHLNLTA